MRHISVPVANTMEFINAKKVSPLLSKVQIKVCYVGQEPNRNGTVITKEVATKLGENLGGTPIVGYYNQQIKDFEGHNKEIVIDDETQEFKILDTTQAYGFVDTNPKVWFEKFMDDGIEHEYLCVEGYVWTKAFPESKRVVEKGNNQSMELDPDSDKGFWTEDKNYNKRIFIISDGLIEKLCILGEDIEPCFEGSQIKSQFSLQNEPEFLEFKNTMFSMINEIKDVLSKGGSSKNMDKENQNNNIQEETPVVSEQEFAKKDDEKEKEEQNKDNSSKDKSSEDNKDKKEDEEKEKKKNYNLEEIAEYVALQLQFSALQTKYSELEEKNKNLTAELENLREFKLKTDRKEKQDMVNSFFMLSDADKKDVVDNIDKYTLDDIEAKLSIICVRNKVNFNHNESEKDNSPASQYSFNLNQIQNDNDNTPDWVKAVRNKQKG